METREELEGLRREVAHWTSTGQSLERRIAALEARLAAEAARAAAPLRPLPPPLPPARAAEVRVSEAPAAPGGLEAGVVGEAAAPAAARAAAAPADAAAATRDAAAGPPPPIPAGLPFLAPQPRGPFAPRPERPGAFQRLGAWVRSLGPKEEMPLEMALGTYWLPRAAVLVLAVGVLWLTGFAIDRFRDAWWMPYARIALGYGIAAGLLGFGRWQEARRPGFARVVLAGGIGLSYLVTYATYFFEPSRIAPGPEMTLALLALVVAAWMAVAQLRKSALLAGAVVALGHATVAISTLTLARPSPWAVTGLIALSAASGFFLARNRWYAVGAIGLIGSYANHFFWLSRSPGSDRPLDFALAMAVLAAYGLLFAVSEWLAPEDLRRRAVPMRWRTAFVSCNSAAVLGIGALLMHGFAFARPHTYVFYFILAAALAALGWAYRFRAKLAYAPATPIGAADPLFNAYVTKSAVVCAFGLQAYFNGNSLTMALALEGLALALAARRSGLVVTRLLALGALAAAIAHGAASVWDAAYVPYARPAYPGLAVSAAIAVAALLGAAWVWHRRPWPAPALHGWPPGLAALLWSIDCNETPPAPGRQRPLGGFEAGYALAFSAVLLGIGYLAQLVAWQHLGPVAAVLALALAACGVALRFRCFTAASLVWMLAGWGGWHYAALLRGPVSYTVPSHAMWCAAAAIAAAALLAYAELARRSAARAGAWPVSAAGRGMLPYIVALLGAEVAAYGAHWLLELHHLAAMLAALALAGLLYAALAAAAPIAAAAALWAGLAGLSLSDIGLAHGATAWYAASALAVAAAAIASDARVIGPRTGLRPQQSLAGGYWHYAAAALAVYGTIDRIVPDPWHGAALAAAAVVFALGMLRLHPAPLGACAAALATAAAAVWFDNSALFDGPPWHAGAWAVFAAAVFLDRWLERRAAFARRLPGAIAIAAAWPAALAYAIQLWDVEFDIYIIAPVAYAYGAYALLVRGVTPGILAALTAAALTSLTVAISYDTGMPPRDLMLNYGAAILFWFLAERAAARGLPNAWPKLRRASGALLVTLVCGLLALLLERLPITGGSYLSISWTLAAVLMYAVSLPAAQPYYRYAGLAAFAGVLYRLVLIDTRGLDTPYRIAGMIFLGLVLLAVAVGYLKARDRQRAAPPPPLPPGP